MPNSTVALVGNLVKDPELRFTNGNTGVANFTIAVSEGTRDNPRTSFYDVTAWRELGEHVAESLSKGQRVVVFGVLQQRTWDDKQSGGKRSKVEVVAEAVGPDLRWANVVVTAAPKQGSFPDSELPSPEQRTELVNAARQAVDHPGEYRGEPF